MEKVEQWYNDPTQKELSQYNNATNEALSTIGAAQFTVLKKKMTSIFEDAASLYQPKMK